MCTDNTATQLYYPFILYLSLTEAPDEQKSHGEQLQIVETNAASPYEGALSYNGTVQPRASGY